MSLRTVQFSTVQNTSNFPFPFFAPIVSGEFLKAPFFLFVGDVFDVDVTLRPDLFLPLRKGVVDEPVLLPLFRGGVPSVALLFCLNFAGDFDECNAAADDAATDVFIGFALTGELCCCSE